MSEDYAKVVSQLRTPEGRKRFFDLVEHDFGQILGRGEAGFRCYRELFDIVERAGETAVTEFQKRFVPMLDQEHLRERYIAALTESRRGRDSDQ